METLLLKVSVLQEFANLFSNIGETKWQMHMWAVGGLLIYLESQNRWNLHFFYQWALVLFW